MKKKLTKLNTHYGGNLEYTLDIEKNTLAAQTTFYNAKIDLLRQKIIWILDNFGIKHSSRIASGYTKDIINKLKSSPKYNELTPELQRKLTYKVVKRLKQMDDIFAKLFTLYEKLNKLRLEHGLQPIDYTSKHSNKYNNNNNNNVNNLSKLKSKNNNTNTKKIGSSPFSTSSEIANALLSNEPRPEEIRGILKSSREGTKHNKNLTSSNASRKKNNKNNKNNKKKSSKGDIANFAIGIIQPMNPIMQVLK